MAVIGVMAVVLVFAAVLSMAKGFERTMVAAGSDDTAIVLRSGSTAELNSGLSNEQAVIIAGMPGSGSATDFSGMRRSWSRAPTDVLPDASLTGPGAFAVAAACRDS